LAQEYTHDQSSISHKIVRNTFSNIAGRFWGIAVAVFLTPYIIGHIGVERYGIWALVGVITGYFGLLDFGIGSSFVKYIAEFYARKEHEKINSLINTGFIFYSALGLVIIGLAAVSMGLLLFFLKIPLVFHDESSFVIFLGVVLFVGSNALSPFVALQTGLQRMDIINKVSIAVSIPSILVTMYVLEHGFGLRGLMINNAIVFVMTSVVNIVVAFRILPGLRINVMKFDRVMFAKLFTFGYRIQLARLSTVVTAQTDKILIVYFLSIGLVTYYQLGSSMIYYAVSVCGLLVSALMPAFTEIEAKGDRGVLVDAYLRSAKYLSAVTVPIFIFLMFIASKVIFVWMGLGYSKAILVIRILCVGFMINTIAQPATAVCMAIDRPQFMSIASVIIVFLNVGLSLVLVKIFGFFGIAWGSALAVNIGTIYFLSKVHAALQVPLQKLFSRIATYLIPSVAAAVVAGAVDLVVMAQGIIVTRVISLWMAVIQFLIFGLVYSGWVYYAGLFDLRDVEFVQQKIPFLYRIWCVVRGKRRR
jgi:O-antigen/teichoic acid export membrane protein